MYLSYASWCTRRTTAVFLKIWSDQLTNSQKVDIKQYYQLDQIQACGRFHSSFTFSIYAVFGRGLLNVNNRFMLLWAV